MTIVEGQIQTLKKLKASLSESGVTRFGSIAEIRRFLKDFEAERKQLPTRIENEIEAEIQDMRSTLAAHQQAYEEQKTRVRNEVDKHIRRFEVEIARISDRSSKNTFYRVLYFLRLSSLSRKASKLRNDLESIVNKKTNSAKKPIAKLESKLENILKNRDKLISKRCKESLDDLIRTKEIVDELYPLVAGSIGETAVVNALQQLSDDYYLINDFSLEFYPPIYNKKENDRIFSIQIDHLLICQSGVFLLETKNWSRFSIENLDLRSPVEQILRTNFALFVLLNSQSRLNDVELNRHHWGAKKIPIRNVIVMIKEKPKEEFKHVKVVSLNELIGYIQYFDQTFDRGEVNSIFQFLKKRMSK